MNTNVKSAWLLSKMVREAIKEHGEGGSIINVSSTGGLRASGGLGGSVSKAAIIMLTQVCAKEWGTDGIRVNCIAPGLIKTEFSRALWDNEAILKNSLTQSPLRIGEPGRDGGRRRLLRQCRVIVHHRARHWCSTAAGSPRDAR
ncbi:MAG: SDR family oxidoreductase [Dehalococcoidia bacterium]